MDAEAFKREGWVQTPGGGFTNHAGPFWLRFSRGRDKATVYRYGCVGWIFGLSASVGWHEEAADEVCNWFQKEIRLTGVLELPHRRRKNKTG